MASSSDGPPVLPPMPDFSAPSVPFSSAGDMKFHLQSILDNKEKQLQQAATLGQRVLAQRVELEERIRQLQELEAEKAEDDAVDTSARERYHELADTMLVWDSENAQLSTAFGSSKKGLNDKMPSPSFAFTELPREEPERSKPSAGTSAAQSRRAKNAAHRADDVEFAFEIGSGLLTEVRRLQSLLGERDKAIQDMKEEKDDADKTVEALRTALRQQEQSSDKYKEENWNLEVKIQELHIQLSDYQASTQRLEGEQKRLTKLLAASREASDQYKNESERLATLIQETKAKHETDIAQARRHAAGLARDKSDLQQTIDNLKNEVVKASRRFPRFGSPLTPNGGVNSAGLLTPAGDNGDGDLFTGGASTNRRKMDSSLLYDEDLGDFDETPDASPIRPPFLVANHSNEVEALQQRLAHAHRQINTLKGTLNREKQLRMEYRSKLEATSTSGLPTELTEDGVDDVDEDEELSDSKKSKARKLTPFKVGGRGRGRGRGRGNISLMQRLGMATASPASEYNVDDLNDSPPPVPPIPIRFSQPEEDENSIFSSRNPEKQPVENNDEEPHSGHGTPSRSPSPMETNSNRASVTSVEGMDPVFANVLRRVPSIGSSYTSSPLRRALSGSARGRRTVGRRSRGGVPYKEARPPSLVDAPDVLSTELLGEMGTPMKTQDLLGEIEEMHKAVNMVDSASQTEPELVPEPVVVVKPETTEMAIQVEPESEAVLEPLPAVLMIHQEIQTDVVVVEMAEVGTQHAYEPLLPPSPLLVHVGTDPEPEPEPEPIPPPVLIQVGTQTIHKDTFDADAQTSDTVFSRPEMRKLGVGLPVGDESRRTTITQYDTSFSSSSSGDTTIIRPFLADHPSEVNEDEEDNGNETETGAETETDVDDYHDARQSISMYTPSGAESREEFHSVMTMTDNEYSESEDDDKSIKASRMTASHDGNASSASVDGVRRRPSSYYAALNPPPRVFEDASVSADLRPEPERIVVEVMVPAPVLPKPEVKEISIQTDEWKPSPPPAPTPVPTPVTNPGLYRVGSTSGQHFHFIPPPTPSKAASGPTTGPLPTSTTSTAILAGPASATIPVGTPGPLSSILRETSGVLGRSRTSVTDRRQSLESAISSVADEAARTRVPSTATMLTVVDRSKPPMMILPPPPKLPPPSSMPPPNFIPERKVPTGSSTGDMPPPRPSSPPPPELVQRATTPTFGSVLTVPGKGTYNVRQHGSSMPPSQAGLRPLPSTSSFRSAANAAAHAQYSSPQVGTLNWLSPRERVDRRQFSQTSLISERSVASPRSSMSSEHFRPQETPLDPVTPNRTVDITADMTPRVHTDPAVIHAITQTMIGEFLYKYTRRTIGKGHGTTRHKRFFWVHPYTRTLYWSSADPGSANVSESSAKSAYIESVRSVLDPNPMPPGVYQYSVIVSTPQREMKFTAPSKERHDIWLNALQYLLARPTAMSITSPGNVGTMPQSPLTQVITDEERRRNASPRSQRSVRSVRGAETWNTTPRGQRSRSQLSVRGSIGKRSNTPAAEYLRWGPESPYSPYSPTRSFVDVLTQEEDDDLDFELHGDGMSDEGYEGLENVRACCDGRHTVGHSGKHHHHHQRKQSSDNLEPVGQDHPARPISPSAWSFRSRAGSVRSNDGGIFSWGRGDDGKLRFGSRRSRKPIPMATEQTLS